ncbi:hypothetical protein Btru_019023 [Bulinus truncatus]|nr:hypothetical protein Btru_019023 [Bulinus truncatus]
MKYLFLVIATCYVVLIVCECKKVKRCSSSTECVPGECCVAKGKKQTRRHCTAVGVAGETCFVNVTSVNDVNFVCPCMDGLTCIGTGVIEIPLGQRGNCSKAYQ